MQENELNHEVDASDFTDELTDEALDRDVSASCGILMCVGCKCG